MKRIILSRTDNIGDVVLTLPLAGFLKRHFPETEIIFLGKKYTKAVIETSRHVDRFEDWEEISLLPPKASVEFFRSLKADAVIHVFPRAEIAVAAWKAKIPLRIGTSHRFFHWFTCNRLVSLSRKNSNLHEAQLNLQLASTLLKDKNAAKISLKELESLFSVKNSVGKQRSFEHLFQKNKYHLIIHPKSKGSALEWGIHNYSRLIEILPMDKFQVFITGTAEERQSMEDLLFHHKELVTDMTGRLTLEELVEFIRQSDGLLAASTGVLHIAAMLGKDALGLYSPMRPIFPTRWAPIGQNASFLVAAKDRPECAPGKKCDCMDTIVPQAVADFFLEKIR